MFNKVFSKGLLSLITVCLTAPLFASEINVYTHRHYATDKKLNEMFTKETGIKVKIVKGKSSQLLKRLEIEGEYSPADVLVTVDAGRLEIAKSKGLLQSITSEKLNKAIPEHLRDPDGMWYGLTKRARVIVYSKDRVDPKELSTYEDLANPKWKGRIAIRSSNNVYNQSLLASIIAHDGEEKALEWANAVVENLARKPKGNDKDQAKAIAAGIADIAIMNTYYIGRMAANNKDLSEQEISKQIGIFFPNQDGRGTHINISGIGVAKYSKNKENAIKYIEFLASKKAQAIYVQENFEYPVLEGVKPSELIESWGKFKEDSLPMNTLGELNSKAVKVFDKAGWR